MDYWELTLMSRGLAPPVPILPPEAFESDETLSVIKDPMFEMFLAYGPGKTGIGPKSVSEFLSLNRSDREFYMRVFKRWKKLVGKTELPKLLPQSERSEPEASELSE